MVFKHVYLGKNHHGVDEYSCSVINNKNDFIGYCKYYKPYEYTDDVYIEFIDIRYEHRRRGYATSMVLDLQSRYVLKWDGRFSEVGKLWYKNLIKKGVITE